MDRADNEQLLLQTLDRLERKIDAQEGKIQRLFKEQNDVILNNTLGVRKLVEKLELRVVTAETDIRWHTKWIAGTSTALFGMIGTVALWCWYIVSRS